MFERGIHREFNILDTKIDYNFRFEPDEIHPFFWYLNKRTRTIMHSRKEFVGYSGVSEHPTYKNVQQLAQEYKRMTASRDSINCFRSRDQGNFQTAGRHAPDRCPPKSASRSEGPERSSPSKVYKQGRRAEDLYENARFYRKQAIYNWMTSSEQVTM